MPQGCPGAKPLRFRLIRRHGGKGRRLTERHAQTRSSPRRGSGARRRKFEYERTRMSEDKDRTNSHNDETNPKPPEFDFSRYPGNTLFHDRREGRDRRQKGTPASEQKEPASPREPRERRAKKERRRRIDPTTFEKQYTD